MSKKNVSTVVSGLGLGLGILEGLVAAIREEGGTDEDIHRLATPEGRLTIAAMAKLAVVRKADDSFMVTVNYALSLADMIAAGRYDWTNDDITAEHFPIAEKGTADLELVLVHLDCGVTTVATEAEMAKRGLKPATLAELLAVGAKYPDLQRQFPIVALGSSWVCSDGGRFVPCLDGGGRERRLGLSWGGPGRGWGGGCRFLARRA